ncbi:hypothetical protein F5Y03DRAFT_392808 [Xylaria venustula]|nr:hypothetical protein F5Y03DRAFT_392808 [Xylaria venustula]
MQCWNRPEALHSIVQLNVKTSTWGHMCTYVLLKWYCEDCGAWYTSDEIKSSDCDDFAETGECEEKNITTEESDAEGLCDECTRAREG